MAILRFVVFTTMLVAGGLGLRAQGTVNTVVTLAGSILSATTLEPVECTYGIYDGAGRKVGQTRRASVSNGYLVTGLQPGEDYTLRIEDPRFFKQDYSIQIPKTSRYLEISKDFTVRTMEAGRKITLTPNPFDLKKTSLKVGAEELLDEVVKILTMNAGVKVDVICYPDAEGSAADITKFTTERGAALKAHLAQRGVSADRVNVRATSTTDPINPPPLRKGAKGKRYVGPVYIIVTSV